LSSCCLQMQDTPDYGSSRMSEPRRGKSTELCATNTHHPSLPKDPEVERALAALTTQGREAAAELVNRAVCDSPILATSAMQKSVWLTAASEAARATTPADVSLGAKERPTKQKPHTARTQGREVAFRDLEPWPDPVDGATLLDEIVATLLRFLSLPEHAAEAIALWCVFAHAHDSFTTSPLLAFTSPAKRCGKTTALQITGEIVPRPLHAANVTPAAIFRSVDRLNPTLLVDEADTFLSGKDELRGVLNSGHSRRNARLIRTVGESHEVKSFSTWAPKVVALIGKLPETLEDRSVVVPMKRRARGERLERLRNDRLDELQHLARKAASWARSMEATLADADPDVPDALDDRAADNWRPLLAIADKAGSGWPQRARKAALTLSAGRSEDAGNIQAQLLADIHGAFEDADRLSSGALVETLRGLQDRPWADWSHGRGLTPNGLARLLSPFNIKPKDIRFGDHTLKGYERDAFDDPFARYLPGVSLNRDTATTRPGTEERSLASTATQSRQLEAPPPTKVGSDGIAEGNVSPAAGALERVTASGSGAPVGQCCGVAVQPGHDGETERTRTSCAPSGACPHCGGRAIRWEIGEICTGCHRLLPPGEVHASEAKTENGADSEHKEVRL